MEKKHIFDQLKEGQVVLISSNESKYPSLNLSITKHFVNNKKYQVVYITANRPYSILKKIFDEHKIDTNKIFFIDAVTPSIMPMRTGNSVFVGSPRDLTNISISANSVLVKSPLSKVVILDSLNSLLMYNDMDSTVHFVHFVSNKLKELKKLFIMIYLKKEEDKKELVKLAQFCDKTIEVK